MSVIDAIVFVVQVLSWTFVAVYLFAGIIVFQNIDEKPKPEERSTAGFAPWDIYWGMAYGSIMAIANVFLQWKKNPAGRRCIYAAAIALAIHFGTYLIGS